ncbi:putative peroxisomal targeting signal type 2 receptor [Trypanosoma theileri]|uniref:Putative peroxisomal targeting signal type 2 receptor n=1 Tax=Trypanosoma theileri TaxID=67003 RepID=A0A1X0P3N3_9TRYP|nr:putative peroxisomal targeting signal type 2 receptor [Trypanosoma theileri]ORC91532.1 putative peroxisomal targeting signal type 2 receptor [Trypanosoma theileri]
MKKSTKRVDRAEEDLPTTRRRLRDREEMEEEEVKAERIAREEKERQLQRRVAAENNEDEEWEDASDEEEEYEDDDDDCMDEIIEEEIIDDGADDDEDDEDYAEFQRETDELSKGMRRVTFDDAAMPQDEDNEGDEAAPTIWRSDQAEVGTQDMQLEYSNKAYDSFFQLRTEYPCLSFDVLQDKDAGNRTKYPLSLTLVCGSQADELSKNQLYVLRITNICRTKHDADSDSDSDGSYIGDEGDSEDDNDQEEEEVNNGEPIMVHRTISHYGTANRVRCAHHNTNLVAVWSDAGHVQVFDLENDVSMLCDHAAWAKKQARQGIPKKQSAMLFCTPSTSHKTEGYGLDWSTVTQGVFASGDCNGDLFVWKPSDDGRWKPVASSTSSDHAPSVEEIQWSPTQADVLIATRVGGVVEVWDTRDMRKSKISWQADPTDINVASWNRARQASHLLVTGADSGAVAVWDLRKIGESTPIQQLPWHKGSITSVEFSLHNESVLSVTGDDGQCTLWDLSLERDPSEEKEVIGELFGRQDLTGIPDQLMFQHQGLVHPKEAHWHAQIPGMVITTDYAGLHLFRPMNWRSLMK